MGKNDADRVVLLFLWRITWGTGGSTARVDFPPLKKLYLGIEKLNFTKEKRKKLKNFIENI